MKEKHWFIMISATQLCLFRYYWEKKTISVAFISWSIEQHSSNVSSLLFNSFSMWTSSVFLWSGHSMKLFQCQPSNLTTTPYGNIHYLVIQISWAVYKLTTRSCMKVYVFKDYYAGWSNVSLGKIIGIYWILNLFLNIYSHSIYIYMYILLA